MSRRAALWPFAGFYFCYFSFVGVTSPYWGLYLASLGLTPWAIAVLASMPSLARISAPGFWGWLADRHGQRQKLIRLTTLAAAISFAGLWLDTAPGPPRLPTRSGGVDGDELRDGSAVGANARS